VLTQAVVKSPAGGDYLSTQCRNYLNEKGIEIVPPCMVASKEVTKAEEAANFKRRVIQAKLTDSWHNYMIKQVMQDFQASVLQVSDNLYDEEVVKTMPAIHYEFPNGFHKDFGVERFKIPEPMFNPVAGAKSGIQPTLGVGPLVTTSVGMCDIDIRPVSVPNTRLAHAHVFNVVGYVRKCCGDRGKLQSSRFYRTSESRSGS
jgi:actin-related protein